MKAKVSISILVALLAFSFLFTACGKRAEKPTLTPQAASKQVFDSVMALARKGEITSQEQYMAARDTISAGIIDKVKSDSLQGERALEYGQLLYWAGRDEKAKRVFNDLRKGKDKFASAAWKELINMEVEGKRYAQAEAMMKEYRSTVPPDTSDIGYLSGQCEDLFSRYTDEDQPDAAIRVCMDELSTLPLNAPYESFSLVENVAKSMMDAGRESEGRALLQTYCDKLEAALAEHMKGIPADSAAKDPIAGGYKSLIENISSFEAQYDLVGKKAPAFKFVHVYNADSGLSLAKLKGKVVMIDFWATWCAPCIMSFGDARKLYAEYKDKGFEIVGVTSFQGRYRDRAAGISEGTREKPLDQKREIELTQQFITKHGMVWPVAFSDRSVFDPQYKVTGIPTFMLLDRDGVIRYFQVGIGGDKQKRRIIEKMLGS